MPATFLILLLLVIASSWIASRLSVPDAIVWCLAGFAVAFIPKFPSFQFNPQIALLVFLPPLIYASAVDLPWPEFRDNLRPIGVLAIGLVFATAVTAAAFAHRFGYVSWAIALAIGALVSPTDPVAASAVATKVGMPRRLIAILEGEGLVNDAVALTLFRLSLTAAVAGGFSIESNLARLVAILVGEPIYGLVLGIAVGKLRARIKEPVLEIAVSLVTPFVAYLIPESLGGSGILATLATGMYIGERRSTFVPAGTRLHATSFWQMIVFLLNGILFVVAGIELNVSMSAVTKNNLLSRGLEIAALVVVLRFAWCAASWFLFRLLRRVVGHERHPMPFRQLTVIAWSGIRGPISLAAAMAIPAFSGNGSFQGYEDALSITAVVVIGTLFFQGLSLPALVRLLGVEEDAQRERREMKKEEELGFSEGVKAALNRLSELETQGKVSPEQAERFRRHYDDPIGIAPFGDPEQKVLSDLLSAERERILELRNQRRISDTVLGRLERELDLRQSLLD